VGGGDGDQCGAIDRDLGDGTWVGLGD
jgi:hypothetical protein